ncbi:cation:proton antiporter family protein [Corallincola holothuriorum]|uniref:cation:proton antiporter family protein n=1 Tax=Corallincola holothuriorum TaxID=2282215 RepID=UPI001F447DF1|nr:cation:proton antiporter family protein [Corallincola holothuriorum]
MDPIVIAAAFTLGLLVSRIGLPPMIGFLGCGFLLHAVGFEPSIAMQEVADLGVTLLLFTIGLKLNIKSLLKPEVWGTATLHMGITIGFFTIALILLAALKISLFATLNWSSAILLSFALSFSSTVFAVKVLEDKGEMQSLYGRVAIGILVMQDIFAVVYLTLSTGKIPSVWAVCLLGLPFIRPLMYRLLDRAGHGEMLILYGLMMALLLGAGLFELVGLKPDLGALIIGILLANHPKSGELAKSLFSFKELFLVAFFLNIGLQALPTWESVAIAALLCLVLIVKVIIYFGLLTKFRLRARTATLSSLSLANYSEFGLIVGAIGVSNGWLSPEWLVIIAIALSLSMAIASPLNLHAASLYRRYRANLHKYQRSALLKYDSNIELSGERCVIFGMGRIGTGVYDEMLDCYGNSILGVETDMDRVEEHRTHGRNVIQGDATDSDFWEKLSAEGIELVYLAMPSHHGNQFAAKQFQRMQFNGQVAAIVHFPDEAEELKALGVNSVFNLYEEAGAGFAEHVTAQLLENASLKPKESQ